MPRRRALAFLAALTSLAAAPQDLKKWAEGYAYFQRCATSRDLLERARASEELDLATSEEYDKTCWTLLSRVLRHELGQEAKGEEHVSGDVTLRCG